MCTYRPARATGAPPGTDEETLKKVRTLRHWSLRLAPLSRRARGASARRVTDRASAWPHHAPRPLAPSAHRAASP